MARTVLVDSNLLFVLIVGSVSRMLVGRARRTEKYSPEDFDLLQSALAEYDDLVVTPHVITETSNLLGYLSEPLLSKARVTLRHMLISWGEHYAPSTEVVNAATYVRLGVTDSALYLAKPSTAELLTDDFPLYLEVSRAGRPVVNFTHLREQRGTL